MAGKNVKLDRDLKLDSQLKLKLRQLVKNETCSSK